MRSEVVSGLGVEDPLEHRDQAREIRVGARHVTSAVQLFQVGLPQSRPEPRSDNRRSKNSRVERPLPSRNGWA